VTARSLRVHAPVLAPALDEVRVIGDEALRKRKCIPAPVDGDFDACRHSLLLSTAD
jgi:hypothetical protein